MSEQQSTPEELQRKLPEIPFSELSEGTKDFILASTLTGKPTDEVIRDVLREAAAAAGFHKTGHAA